MDKEKYVDESWKEQASQEKDVLAGISEKDNSATEEPAAQSSPQPAEKTPLAQDNANQDQEVEINFLNYITSLGFQAMIFMGEIPNPATNEVDKNLVQAKFLIDTLSMLNEKTAGNLNDQEKNLLENSIYELQMRYVQISKDEPPSGESKG